MGKYWKDLCTVNENAYVDYKRLGAKETALLEISRHRNKIQLQEAAVERGIQPDKMLDFQKLFKKENEEIA